jgi:hypothetical protein
LTTSGLARCLVTWLSSALRVVSVKASSACLEQKESASAPLSARAPGRITDIPRGCRVALVRSLADGAALTDAFSGATAVLTALGVTATSRDRSALLSGNMATVEQSMLAAGVDRIIIINTLLASPARRRASLAMRFFSWLPGRVGRGAREQQAVVDALGNSAFLSLRWTLIRAGVNSRAKDERPAASADWEGALNSSLPVSYEAMGRWMLEEAATNAFVRAAPIVSRRRRTGKAPALL